MEATNGVGDRLRRPVLEPHPNRAASAGPSSRAVARLPRHRRGLRILEVAPVWLEVPPDAYGGIEWIVHWLSEGLRDRGHDVLLLTVGGSTSSVEARSSMPAPPPKIQTDIPAEGVHAIAMEEVAAEFQPDVIHDHTLLGPILATPFPHVATAHGPLDGVLGDYYRMVSTRTPLIAISDFQRRAMPDARWLGTVHNAIDVPSFPFAATKDDYFLFLGRICEDKGTHIAARAARRAGRRLLIAGRATEPHERRYFDEAVAPLLGDGVEFVGEADSEMKRRLLAGARALLCPIMWDEPFGLVLIEALACGTPVISFPRGAAPEIVRDGVTGALVSTEEEMVGAMLSLDIDPEACRASVVEDFDVPIMVDRYESLLQRAADTLHAPTPATSGGVSHLEPRSETA